MIGPRSPLVGPDWVSSACLEGSATQAAMLLSLRSEGLSQIFPMEDGMGGEPAIGRRRGFARRMRRRLWPPPSDWIEIPGDRPRDRGARNGPKADWLGACPDPVTAADMMARWCLQSFAQCRRQCNVLMLMI